MTWGHPAGVKVILFAGDVVSVLLAMFIGAFLRLGEPINILL